MKSKSYDNTPINSPFRYAGGKFYARKLIFEHIPRHKTYVEPFAGGASIFFAKTKAENSWLNDIDKDLINCFRVIKDTPNELIESLEGETASKKRHTYYKNKYKPKNDLERAKRWFYLNRTSYSGIMNMQNCFWGYGDKYSMRPENWPRNILRVSDKLQGVKLSSLDFKKVLEKVGKGAFLFIDPPYYNADQDKFYSHAFSLKDHHILSKTLKKLSSKFKFLLTYDNSKEIRDLYSWTYAIYNKRWNYTINRTDDQKNRTNKKGKRYKGREIFIVNYDSISQKSLFNPTTTQ